MSKGETLSYENLQIAFDDFDLSDFDPEAGRIHIGAVFQVTRDGETFEVEPTFKGGQGAPVITPAVVPGAGGITLDLGRMDAEKGTVELKIVDPTLAPQPPAPASLVLDVSTKPLIGLVWIGTLLIIAGIVMAIGLRRRDIASIPVES
jgi:hypothetical protein